MLQLRFSALLSLAIPLVLALFLSCSSTNGDDDDTTIGGSSSGGGNGGGGTSSSGGNAGGGDGSSSSGDGNTGGNSSSGGIIVDGSFPFTSEGETLNPQVPGLEALSNRIDIEFKNGSAPVITNDYTDRVTITANSENVTVSVNNNATEIYNFVVSGTASNGSVKFYGDIEKKLYLNGVNITNSKGPAINIQQKKKKVTIHLVNGTQNYLADGPNYDTPPGDESAKGTIFSEVKIDFEGSGSLDVKGKYKHAIVVDNDIEIHNGKITVNAVGDGIHANDQIKIRGGVLNITSVGDAIQSEKPNEKELQDWVTISGGKVKAQTTGIKSHGITSEGPVSIIGAAIVQISVAGNGSKGIKSSSFVEFRGTQKTSIKVSGDKYIDQDDDSSTPAGIKTGTDFFVGFLNAGVEEGGGELTIKSPGREAKGININNGTISAGNVSIEADDDGIKVQPNKLLRISGGTVNIKSAKKKAIDGEYTKTGGTVVLTPVQ